MASPSVANMHPLRAHLALIGVSIVCGVGIWLVVRLNETREQVFNVAVRPVNVDPEVLLTLEPTEVPVRFAYPATEQHRMQSANFWVEVDFGGLKERIARELQGGGDRTLSREGVRNSIRAEAFNIAPLDLLTPQVRWEARLRWARGRVVPNVVGKPAAGFLYDATRVTIEGSQEIFVLLSPEMERERDQRSSGDDTPLVIETEPIDITGREGIVSQQVGFVLPPGISLLPSEDRPTRTVVVEIVEETITRTISNVPISYDFVFAGAGLTATIEPAKVDVIVRGRLRAVNTLDQSMIRFGLFGVAERAGESREVAVETRISDTDLRTRISEIETRPRTVTVTISEDGAALAPAHGVTPSPTPRPEAAPAISTYDLIVEGGTLAERLRFGEFLGAMLPPGYELLEASLNRDDVEGFRISTEDSIQDLLSLIVENAGAFPGRLAYKQQTDSLLVLALEVATPTTTPTPEASPTPLALPADTDPTSRDLPFTPEPTPTEPAQTPEPTPEPTPDAPPPATQSDDASTT